MPSTQITEYEFAVTDKAGERHGIRWIRGPIDKAARDAGKMPRKPDHYVIWTGQTRVVTGYSVTGTNKTYDTYAGALSGVRAAFAKAGRDYAGIGSGVRYAKDGTETFYSAPNAQGIEFAVSLTKILSDATESGNADGESKPERKPGEPFYNMDGHMILPWCTTYRHEDYYGRLWEIHVGQQRNGYFKFEVEILTGARGYKYAVFSDPYDGEHASADETHGNAGGFIREKVVIREPADPYTIILEAK